MTTGRDVRDGREVSCLQPRRFPIGIIEGEVWIPQQGSGLTAHGQGVLSPWLPRELNRFLVGSAAGHRRRSSYEWRRVAHGFEKDGATPASPEAVTKSDERGSKYLIARLAGDVVEHRGQLLPVPLAGCIDEAARFEHRRLGNRGAPLAYISICPAASLSVWQRLHALGDL